MKWCGFYMDTCDDIYATAKWIIFDVKLWNCSSIVLNLSWSSDFCMVLASVGDSECMYWLLISVSRTLCVVPTASILSLDTLYCSIQFNLLQKYDRSWQRNLYVYIKKKLHNNIWCIIFKNHSCFTYSQTHHHLWIGYMWEQVIYKYQCGTSI